jgi:hypothetical protein
VQETATAAGLCAEVVASGRCFFEQLHVLRLKVESRACPHLPHSARSASMGSSLAARLAG